MSTGMYEVFLLIVGSKDPEILKINAIGFTVVCISYLVSGTAELRLFIWWDNRAFKT